MFNYIIAKRGNHWFLRSFKNTINVPFQIISPRNIYKIKPESIIVKYGVARNLSIPDSHQYNQHGILKASNKLYAKQLLIENNISTPKIVDINNPTYPCIGRPIHHRKGENFYYCNNRFDINRALNNNCEYFQEYICKDKEYRVHVAHNKVLLVQEKEPRREEYKTEKVWNHANGKFFFSVLKWNVIPSGLCPIAVKAVRAMDLDFGAVDIISKDNTFFVCEINTAPLITGYTLLKYSNYFEWLFNTAERKEHFENTNKYIIRNNDYERN